MGDAVNTIHILGKRVHLPKGRAGLMRNAARAALAQAQPLPQPVELSIRLADDVELRALNHEYRRVNAATDVLSFGGEGFVDGHADTLSRWERTGAREKLKRIEPAYLGDIVISMDHCAAQAKAYGHSVDDELRLLVIHGTLHLLGYDHMTAKRKRLMWAAQDRAFALLGRPNPWKAGQFHL
jgi:probable rRNA maturation factor